MSLPLDLICGFLLVGLRTLSLVMVAPVFGMPQVPSRVRLGVGLVLAAAVYAAAGFPRVAYDGKELLLAAGAETVIGLVAGLGARFFFDALRAAGQTAGLGMGMGFGTLLDPSSGETAAPLGSLFSILGLAYAVALNVHTDAVVYLATWVKSAPPGGAVSIIPVVEAALGHAIASIVLSIRLGMPILATIVVGHAMVGLLGRTAPQLNIQSLGFSIAIGAGAYAVWTSAPLVAEIAARAAKGTFAV